MTSVSFLFLSQEDVIECGGLDARRCLETIDKTFKLHAKGETLMGGPSRHEHGIMLSWPGVNISTGKRMMAMPAWVGGEFNMAGCKWYGANVRNPTEHNLPRSSHIITLNDPETGIPLAVMDGTLISAMRTGAAAAVAAKYLARTDSEMVAMLGAGVINRTTLMCGVHALKNLKKVKIFDIRKEKSKAFSEEMGKKLGLEIECADSMKEAVRDSDICHLATAGESDPTLEPSWFKKGSVLNAVSELAGSDDVFMRADRVVVDDIEMHRVLAPYSPENLLCTLMIQGRMKWDDLVELGTIAIGSKQGRLSDEEKITFCAEGMAIEDVTWACVVYKEALKRSVGKTLDLYKAPFAI
jgi:ornithine cyclodeaminase/alanine dehydrogenase-like protein (mu-crystallin family)